MPVSFEGAPMDLTMLIENASRELLAAVDGAPVAACPRRARSTLPPTRRAWCRLPAS